ncbi:hypothetical protein GF367_02810 [Candidatus Woesearchaeota archaeon]|nr:hypothetical protein [Candidatus Woesearchaeota archaeon]
MQALLDDKKAKKKRNPRFTRTDSHKKRRLNPGWRRPKGLQNKMRLRKKGYKKSVTSGYSTPARLKGATERGLAIVTVNTLKELEALDPQREAALIARIGRKKKTALLAAAQRRGVTVANLPLKRYQEKTSSLLKEQEAKKAELQKKAAAKKKQERVEKEREAEKKLAGETTEQDKKQEEKKELDKVLTNKKGM